MGDHRASIKVEFSMHGHNAKQEFWINWSPDQSTACDARITEWFAAQGQKAMENWWAEGDRLEQKQRAETEAAERAELQRLKDKYEPPTDAGP